MSSVVGVEGAKEAGSGMMAMLSPSEEARNKAIDEYKRLVADYADKQQKVKECTHSRKHTTY